MDRTRRAWIQLAKLLGYAVLAIEIGALAFLRVAAVDLAHNPPIDDRHLLNALFFSIQTITTTGYGVGFTVNDDIMVVGSIFMLLGSGIWGVLIAQLASLATIQIIEEHQ